MKTPELIIGALACAALFVCAIHAQEVKPAGMVPASGNKEILHDCHKFRYYNYGCPGCCRKFGLFAFREKWFDNCGCESETRHNKRERERQKREQKKSKKNKAPSTNDSS